MTDREYDLLLQMMNSLEQPLLTESEYRAAVARGAVAPCDSVMQLASPDYAKGWEACRAQVARFVEELIARRENARRLSEAARVPARPARR